MPRYPLLMILILLLLSATQVAKAHGPNDPEHQLFPMGDLKLENGEVIHDFSMSYVTHGALNAERSNAVLMLTAIAGNHHRIDYLIGPGKALDPGRYFIICTDAIGNGLSSSPSNSVKQAGMQFPQFVLRDMVNASERLVRERFGLQHLALVIGPSMGGMQALQFGVSYPDMSDRIVALIPLAKTPAWTTNVLELTRRVIQSDPAWKNGNYNAESPPEQGMRLWARLFFGAVVRSPAGVDAELSGPAATLAWQDGIADKFWKRIDARDWIYQSRAYDQHDVGTSPGFQGDTAKALASIHARTLIMAAENDLLNPEASAREAAALIPGALFVPLKATLGMGHWSGAGATAPENALQNKIIGAFLRDERLQ